MWHFELQSAEQAKLWLSVLRWCCVRASKSAGVVNDPMLRAGLEHALWVLGCELDLRSWPEWPRTSSVPQYVGGMIAGAVARESLGAQGRDQIDQFVAQFCEPLEGEWTSFVGERIKAALGRVRACLASQSTLQSLSSAVIAERSALQRSLAPTVDELLPYVFRPAVPRAFATIQPTVATLAAMTSAATQAVQVLLREPHLRALVQRQERARAFYWAVRTIGSSEDSSHGPLDDVLATASRVTQAIASTGAVCAFVDAERLEDELKLHIVQAVDAALLLDDATPTSKHWRTFGHELLRYVVVEACLPAFLRELYQAMRALQRAPLASGDVAAVFGRSAELVHIVRQACVAQVDAFLVAHASQPSE